MSAKMNDIDNTKLEEAIRAYSQEPSKEGLINLTVTLKDTRLFVPAMAIPEKGGFQPYVVKNPDGDMYMPAFTSQAKFPQNQKYQGMLKLPYKQCVSMLLDQPTLVQGIVLNMHTDNLMLKTNMLELSRKVEQHAQENMRKVYSVKANDFCMVTRYNVELIQIPEKLYAEKLDFIHKLNEDVLCELYKVPYVESGQESHYIFTRDDFEIMELNVRDDLNIMQIVAPTKLMYRTNCRELYIVWNPQTERVGYYVIQRGVEEEKKDYYLSMVNEEGKRIELEDAPAEGNVIGRVMELFETAQDA